MSRIKNDGVFWKYESGDKAFDEDADIRQHRTITDDELATAIADEHVATRLMARIVTNRGASHESMAKRFDAIEDRKEPEMGMADADVTLRRDVLGKS